MTTHVKHVPKHRGAHARPSLEARRAVRTTLVLTSLAAVAAAVTVAGGVVSGPAPALDGAGLAGASVADPGTAVAGEVVDAVAPPAAASADIAPSTAPATPDRTTSGVTPAELGEREPVVSRSDRRAVADPAKARALAPEEAPAMTASVTLADDDPREIAQTLMPQFGFTADQFSCLDSLWTKESGWDPTADNSTSSAYGIPQSLPGEKMASAGADWATNPATQIEWGLGYIQDVYGSPCSAWSHSQAMDWY